MKTLHLILLVIIIVGALNWGLVGAFHFDLIAHFFGRSQISNIIYSAVGVAGILYLLLSLKKS